MVSLNLALNCCLLSLVPQTNNIVPLQALEPQTSRSFQVSAGPSRSFKKTAVHLLHCNIVSAAEFLRHLSLLKPPPHSPWFRGLTFRALSALSSRCLAETLQGMAGAQRQTPLLLVERQCREVAGGDRGCGESAGRCDIHALCSRRHRKASGFSFTRWDKSADR